MDDLHFKSVAEIQGAQKIKETPISVTVGSCKSNDSEGEYLAEFDRDGVCVCRYPCPPRVFNSEDLFKPLIYYSKNFTRMRRWDLYQRVILLELSFYYYL